MRGIEGKNVIVTGAATGIGKSITQRFLDEGAHVVLADLNPDVETTIEKMRQDYPHTRGFSTIVDVTKKADTDRLAKETLDKLGGIDVLVNNAGINIPANPISTMPEADFDRVININLKGVFLCSQAISPIMEKQKSGRIINIGSFWGKTGHPYFSSYCASKAGVIILTQCHAQEMAPFNVTVNCLCPGNVKTKMHTDAIAIEARKRQITYEEMAEIEYDKIPLKRVGQPEEIAAGVVFLASDEAAYITGSTLNVNGGVELH